MKKVIEERRNEAYISRTDGEDELDDEQVHCAALRVRHIIRSCRTLTGGTFLFFNLHCYSKCFSFVLGQAAQ